jgi:hypothetical protein
VGRRDLAAVAAACVIGILAGYLLVVWVIVTILIVGR